MPLAAVSDMTELDRAERTADGHEGFVDLIEVGVAPSARCRRRDRVTDRTAFEFDAGANLDAVVERCTTEEINFHVVANVNIGLTVRTLSWSGSTFSGRSKPPSFSVGPSAIAGAAASISAADDTAANLNVLFIVCFLIFVRFRVASRDCYISRQRRKAGFLYHQNS